MWCPSFTQIMKKKVYKEFHIKTKNQEGCDSVKCYAEGV